MQYPTDNLMLSLFPRLDIGYASVFLWPYANAVCPAGPIIFLTDATKTLKSLGSVAGTLLSIAAKYRKSLNCLLLKSVYQGFDMR